MVSSRLEHVHKQCTCVLTSGMVEHLPVESGYQVVTCYEQPCWCVGSEVWLQDSKQLDPKGKSQICATTP
jgi:hypothetical protein